MRRGRVSLNIPPEELARPQARGMFAKQTSQTRPMNLKGCFSTMFALCSDCGHGSHRISLGWVRARGQAKSARIGMGMVNLLRCHLETNRH
jgi:hypothetical protein